MTGSSELTHPTGTPKRAGAGAQRQGFQVWRSIARQIAPAPDAGAWSDGPAVPLWTAGTEHANNVIRPFVQRMLIKSRPYPLYPDEIGPQPR